MFSDRGTNSLRSALLPVSFYGLSTVDLPQPLATIRTGFTRTEVVLLFLPAYCRAYTPEITEFAL
jgi:hypothetical protein